MTVRKVSFFLIFILSIVVLPAGFAQQNSSDIRTPENKNIISSFLPNSESNLSEILTGYMTVISVLIATDVFFVTVLQGFIDVEDRKKYRKLSYGLLVASLLLVAYGLILIGITQMLILDVIAFLVLLIPIVALFRVSGKW